MSQLTQSIAGTKNLRQTERSPIAQAEDPVLNKSAILKEQEPGIVPPRVVILTALAEEFLAVEKYVPERQELKHPDGTVYERGRFESGGAVWDVLIVETGQGNRRAANETQRAISFFRPDVVLFVGVAGGRKDVSIGDVVASEKIYNYESGRDEIDGFKTRPEAERPDYKLEHRARAIVRSWMRRKRESGEERLPTAFVGAIAAGESVVASSESETAQRLTQNYGDALAVEKEGYGFLGAAREAQGVSALVIRGISDLLDGKEAADKQGSQALAASNASTFAFELLAKLEGAVMPTEVAEHTESVTFDPDQILPTHLTSASIEVLDGGEYYLRAHHGRQDFIGRGQFAPPLLQLPALIESNKNPENLVGEIDICNDDLRSHPSCPVGRFLRWLPHQTNSEAAAEACLTIDDRTNLGIPWELLEVEGMPLGVAVQTIHHCPDIQTNDIAEPCCRGGVLAYAAAASQSWQATYRFHYYSEFREFLSNLKTSQIDYGLVYIDGLELRAALQQNPTASIKRSRLFRSRASLVFVNGQMAFDESVPLSHSAFLTLFLRYGARGVIGSLKRVNTEAAQQVVEMFFSGRKEQNPDVQVTVPTILQRMRQQVYKRLDEEDSSDELCALYLATFLYVYYGHPQTLLHLTPADA